jgi:hypothetical protein
MHFTQMVSAQISSVCCASRLTLFQLFMLVADVFFPFCYKHCLGVGIDSIHDGSNSMDVILWDIHGVLLTMNHGVGA